MFILLFFTVPPKITQFGPVKKLYAFCIEIKFVGNPEPTVKVFRGGNPFDVEKSYAKLHYAANNPDQPQMWDGCIEIETPSHFDNGEYEMKINNSLGSDSATTMAYFINAPGR